MPAKAVREKEMKTSKLKWKERTDGFAKGYHCEYGIFTILTWKIFLKRGWCIKIGDDIVIRQHSTEAPYEDCELMFLAEDALKHILKEMRKKF